MRSPMTCRILTGRVAWPAAEARSCTTSEREVRVRSTTYVTPLNGHALAAAALLMSSVSLDGPSAPALRARPGSSSAAAKLSTVAATATPADRKMETAGTESSETCASDAYPMEKAVLFTQGAPPSAPLAQGSTVAFAQPGPAEMPNCRPNPAGSANHDNDAGSRQPAGGRQGEVGRGDARIIPSSDGRSENVGQHIQRQDERWVELGGIGQVVDRHHGCRSRRVYVQVGVCGVLVRGEGPVQRGPVQQPRLVRVPRAAAGRPVHEAAAATRRTQRRVRHRGSGSVRVGVGHILVQTAWQRAPAAFDQQGVVGRVRYNRQCQRNHADEDPMSS
eukprot:scaffold13750_cov112-Isochrysis_galbana.AAC.2